MSNPIGTKFAKGKEMNIRLNIRYLVTSIQWKSSYSSHLPNKLKKSEPQRFTPAPSFSSVRSDQFNWSPE